MISEEDKQILRRIGVNEKSASIILNHIQQAKSIEQLTAALSEHFISAFKESEIMGRVAPDVIDEAIIALVQVHVRGFEHFSKKMNQLN